MTMTASAIYEHGMLRPLLPLPLAEGARVALTVTDAPAAAPERKAASLSELIRQVVELPMESHGVGFSGREHDRVLYGGGRDGAP